MDKREALRNMLNNMINDKHEEASLDFHNYVTIKSQEITGLASTNNSQNDDLTGDEDDTSATDE